MKVRNSGFGATILGFAMMVKVIATEVANRPTNFGLMATSLALLIGGPIVWVIGILKLRNAGDTLRDL